MYHIVYLTTNLINNKIYVGVHKNTNESYKGSGIILQKAFKKYGKENFKREILHYCLESEHAYELESQIVDQWFVARKDTYNLTVGGIGGVGGNRYPSKFKNISYIDRFGEDKAKYIINKTRVKNIGRKLSIQHKMNISKGLCGHKSWNKGMIGTMIHTEESKQKLRDSRSTQIFTQETYDKIRENKNISIYDYRIINPNGDKFVVTDGLHQFCEDHQLKYSYMLSKIDSGVITGYRNKNLLGKNCVGWEIIKI
jgi:hypothetical protein